MVGEMAGDGALPRACRTINSNDGPTGGGLFWRRRLAGFFRFLCGRHPRRLAVGAAVLPCPGLVFAAPAFAVNLAAGLAEALLLAATRAAGLGACLAEPE